MIEVSARQFQIKFWEYSKGGEVIRVVGRGGVILGEFKPSDCEDQGVSMAEINRGAVQVAVHKEDNAVQNPVFEDMKKRFDVRGPVVSGSSDPKIEGAKEKPGHIFEDQSVARTCFFCKGSGAEYYVMNDEDSGFEEREACGFCFKKLGTHNFRKIL